MADNYRPYFKPETIEAYAEVAYKSYCEFTDWKSLATGQDLPKWENLPRNIQNAWCASAHAILRRAHESRGW